MTLIESVFATTPAPSCITLASLESQVPTPQQRLLAYLQPFTHDNCTVDLEACRQAVAVGGGQQMMMDIAKQLGPNVQVVGWEDTYAFWGFGRQLTASWNGTSPNASMTHTGGNIPFTGWSSILESMFVSPAY